MSLDSALHAARPDVVQAVVGAGDMLDLPTARCGQHMLAATPPCVSAARLSPAATRAPPIIARRRAGTRSLVIAQCVQHGDGAQDGFSCVCSVLPPSLNRAVHHRA
ncbi:hypothetical protein NP493_884g04026 [Ridgeia piscesae]|uniref:Uncharacterized protein n=1 Tax=Ridgeia piscesae TaxID=27915 RepID=A0AAD9KL88_RIDPI|nr:hypothetical protein NP493_884g04026 [Ridgeia piscesae]